jgi:1,2-diacylglycerol 3-alpha-glucosyltransferase
MGMRGHGVARRLDLPYVYTYHTLLKPLAGYASPGLRPILSALAHRNQARMASKAARFILPSHYLYREVTEQDPHLAPRCSVVPTGVHVDRFRPDLDGAAARAAWGVPDDAEVLLYLGRLGFEKRIHVLIDAFERLHERRPNARLVLSGKGPGMDDFRRHAKPLGDAVHFTGFVPDEQLPAHYAAADAFASASDFETQGLTLLEAMATGRPCAVARAGGYLDVIEEDRNCYAFTPGDVDDAADAMERALDAPAALRRAARDTALAYSKDRMMDLLERTYFEAVGRA